MKFLLTILLISTTSAQAAEFSGCWVGKALATRVESDNPTKETASCTKYVASVRPDASGEYLFRSECLEFDGPEPDSLKYVFSHDNFLVPLVRGQLKYYGFNFDAEIHYEFLAYYGAEGTLFTESERSDDSADGYTTKSEALVPTETCPI